MSDLSKEARAGAKSKLARMLADPTHPVDGDASRYTPPGPELGMIQTGERPVTRARFRTGGSVTGAKTTARADRKPRASGGMTATQYLNRDVREANESRAGLKHDGGFARGGAANDGRARARKFMGGPMAGTASPYVSSMGGMGGGAAPAQRAMMPGQAAGGARPFKDGGKAEHGASCKCAKCSGGRVARASGGGNWIAGATKNKGALHKELGVAEGKKIPAKKLEKAAHSENPKLAKRANLAETLKKMPHKAAGGALDGTLQGMRPKGGRLARKAGGSAKKGGMNVNIIIAPPKPQMAMPPPGAMPPRGPQGIPAPPPQAMGPPPGAMPPPGAGAPPPMGAPPMMGRKSGGRAGYPIKDGAGGGKGRLEKIRAYG